MKPSPNPFTVASLLSVACVTMYAQHAQAADRIWSNNSGTWDTTTANWSGAVFANGDNALFSAGTANSALTVGANVNPLNFRSNGANTPATTTITGAAAFTLSLGNGTAGTGNVTAADGTSAYAQNLTYSMGAGSFALVAGSGTAATPTIWNVASTKTFLINGTNVVDVNANTVNLTGAGTSSIQLTNAAAILKSTGGTGTFNVNAGTMVLAGGTSAACKFDSSITVNVASGATLTCTPNSSGGNATYAMTMNLNGGKLAGGSGNPTISGPLHLLADSTIDAGFATNFTGVIDGSGKLTKTGSSTLTLSNANSFTGNASVTGGTLQLGVAGALGSNSVLVDGGGASVGVNAGLTVNNSLTLKRGISSRAILTLGDGATWSGGITVDNTNVTTGNFAAIQAGGLAPETASIVSGPIGFNVLGTPSITSQTLILRTTDRYGKVTGPVSLSNGYVALLDASKWEFSNASNSWGTLDISNVSAIVTVGAANTLSSSGVVFSNVAGTLKLNDQASTTVYNQTIAGLSGNVKVTVDTGSPTLTLNTTADQSASGVISGDISLVKSGAAKQTLTGVNTYFGSTTVNGGTLALGATGELPANDLTISSGTLDLRKGTSSRTQMVSNLSLSNATLDIGLNLDTDRLDALAATISGANTVKLHGSIPVGSYNIITASSPLTGSGTITLDKSDAAGGFTSYSGAKVGNNYVLTVSGTATPAIAYWRGDVSATWNDSSAAPNSNWATASNGTTDTAQIPGASTDVFFSAGNAANTAVTLGADTTINSLTFASGTATVGGANTLSIAGSSASSGNGLDVLSGANATLNTGSLVNIAPSAVQGGGTLTVNGGGLGSGALTVDGTLNLNMNSASTSLAGAATGTISRSLAGTSTLTVSDPANTTNTTFAGAINNGAGTLALTKGGASTLVLSGSSNYSGGTTISGGILRADNSGALGSGSVAISGGMRLSLGDGVTLANAISIGANSSPQGAGILEASNAVTGTVTLQGPINITASPAGGGHFINASSTGTFHVASAITSTVPVVHRNGTIVYSGGGTGYTSMLSTGTVRVGANNGLSTSASITLGSSGNTILDLAGNNQTLVGITKGASGTATVGNSSTTTDSLLTLTGTSVFDGVIADSVGSGTRKTGLAVTGGSLTLNGLNTYTGNTSVSSGATLILADNARLKFGIGATSGVCNSLSGSGTILLNGDFDIDTTLVDASALTTGSWTLENAASLPSAYPSTFQVTSGGTAWTATGDKWSMTVGAKTYTFDEATGILTLASGGFDSWAASKGLTGADAGFDADPDHDGISNGIEFVLGGEPNAANPGSISTALLPTITLDATYLNFTFRRTDDSASLNPFVEYGTGLSTWTKAEAGFNDVIVNEENDGFATGVDKVTVKVPRALAAPDTKFFLHLKVAQ